MRRFVVRHKVILLICLLALVIRVAFFLALQPWDEEGLKENLLITDAKGYHQIALEILSCGGYPSSETFRTPVYPLFVAMMYSLFAGKLAAVLLLQVLLDVVVVFLTYLLGMEVFESRGTGQVAGFLYAISLLPPYFCTRLRTEILFTLILVIGVLIFVKALKVLRPWTFALAGLLIGVATLVKPATLLLPVLMGAVAVWQGRGGRPRRAVIGAVVLLAAFAVTISPWQFRNYRLYGHYALSSIQSTNMCYWSVAMTKAHTEGTSREEALEELVGTSVEGITNPFDQGPILNRIAFEYIRTHVADYIYCHMKGTMNVFLGTAKGGVLKTFRPGWEGWSEDVPLAETTWARTARLLRSAREEYFLGPLLATKQLIEYAFVIVGCVVVFHSREKRLYVVFLILATLYFAGVSGVIGHARYKVPTIPLYLAVSARGFFEIFEVRKRRRRRAGSTD
ncbi:MAG: glycosyltransferase family 39 protein [Candidatus Eisenbacteria sp.]|nr:glycosyltransferase family 39 protein [Candidatus Eisenbacteria bacterium]